MTPFTTKDIELMQIWASLPPTNTFRKWARDFFIPTPNKNNLN